ncbi:hypothetical protein SAMN05421819_2049 [Bryocella elongata]|uniref:Uncharacterized protein n=1 Tax=Bryocella elongata TaxID=863522 RepID=A0A1H5XZP9_9BACT|nr:hypothetical protein [Bryocella elongata]SEG17148.1 hypothetical protein SAMN05421819_2049 [Bryocella elongata]
MPNSQHSGPAERHFQSEHAHDVAAASRDQHQGLSSHEQTKFAEEQAREAHEHNAAVQHHAEHKDEADKK